MQKYFWVFLLGMCLLMTNTAVDEVQTGIAGIATSHILHRPTTPFWIGMTFCVSGAAAMYLWMGLVVRNVLRRQRTSIEGL